MKKAFTLIELLVVIGIIAVLMGVLLGALSGTSDSALAAKCLANMKNLANACQSRGMATGYFPRAQSGETFEADEKDGIKNVKIVYHDAPGWISWYSKDQYPATASKKSSCPTVSLYSDNYEEYTYALTNGALWRYTGSNSKVYVCPLHQKKMPNARWSYLMNPKLSGASYGGIKGADRTLLFSEVPFIPGHGDWMPEGTGTGDDTDPVLNYSKNEHIGCNHKNGKNWFAHVAFADGHVEKLKIGSTQTGTDMCEMTEWLCKGIGIGFNGAKYEKLTE